jgi:eukaryotic-like serine/threonine-protein kinase
VLTVVALAGGGALAAAHLDGGAGTAAGPAVIPSPSWTPPPMPAGYRLAREKNFGFSVPVPKGWSRSVADGGDEVRYVSKDGFVGLRIGVLKFAGPSPLRSWQQVEGQTRAKVDDYQRMRMSDTTWRGQKAAIWEFSFQGGARAWRAIDLGFGKEGGTGYAIYLSAPAADWAKYQPVFQAAADGIRIAQ